MRRLMATVLVAALATLAAGCEVADPGPGDVLVPPADPMAGMHLSGAALRYGPEIPQVLDVWLPDAAGPRARPALVWFHGGGWTFSNRDALEPAAAYVPELARRLDAAVVAVDFRQAPEPSGPDGDRTTPAHRLGLHTTDPVPLTTLVADLTAALAWLRAHAGEVGIDPNRLVLLGDSSGGQLAGLVAAAGAGFATDGPPNAASGRGAPGVAAVVSLAGPTDLELLATTGADVLGTPAAEFVESVLGCSITECPPGLLHAADPVSWVGPATPPTWLVAGALDELVAPVHARRWHDRLVEVRGTDQIDAIDLVDTGPPEHQGHGGLQDGMNLTLLEAWLRDLLS